MYTMYTMYINPTKYVDNLDSDFTHNIFGKIISGLLDNLLPTDPQCVKQGRVYICLILGSLPGRGEDIRAKMMPGIYI